MKRICLIVLFAVLTVWSTVAVAHPPGAPPPPRGIVAVPEVVEQPRQASQREAVNVAMMVVHATESHSNVDQRLRNLTRYLSHMRYTGYSLLDTHQAELTTGGSQTFEIQGNREMTITLLSKDERQVRLRVQIMAGRDNKLLETTLSINRNATFIVAGPRFRDGILVLPLTARY